MSPRLGPKERAWRATTDFSAMRRMEKDQTPYTPAVCTGCRPAVDPRKWKPVRHARLSPPCAPRGRWGCALADPDYASPAVTAIFARKAPTRRRCLAPAPAPNVVWPAARASGGDDLTSATSVTSESMKIAVLSERGLAERGRRRPRRPPPSRCWRVGKGGRCIADPVAQEDRTPPPGRRGRRRHRPGPRG